MRLKAEIWVKAYIRQLSGMAIAVAVARRGDRDAGAVYVKINMLDGRAQVLRPALSGLSGDDTERRWSPAFPNDAPTEDKADAYLARQMEFDPDIWIVEIEDRNGRHFLDDFLTAE